MKKNILILLVLFCFINCKTQNQVISLSSPEARSSKIGAYYKDVENELLPFLGSWKFTNGNTTFQMTLIKKTMIYNDIGNYYNDMVIGEYLYKENGVEKVNTINLLANTTLDPYEHNISGKIILHKNSIPPCNDCQTSEKRLYLYFGDPNRNDLSLSGKIELRRVDENGVEKLKLILRETGNIILEDGMVPEFTSFNLPWGTYILTRP